ncbi:MAG: phosphotransferase, partial [Acidobacteriota bacterium]|nr:phosphotransferase [Acidobacteriota bacterium]
RAVSVVHGDWSPKNLLAADGEMWAIDWEVVHFGDPGFDAGFLLNHLVLKSIAMPERRTGFEGLARVFLEALAAELGDDADGVIASAFEHLPALLLARADGKSPAEYLDEAGRERARAVSRSLMTRRAGAVEDVFGR